MRSKKRRKRSKRIKNFQKLDEKTRASIRRTKQMLNIPCSGRDRRGFEAEDKVAYVLEKFKRRKKIFIGGRIISNVKKTMHYSFDDKNGKDIIVEFKKNGGNGCIEEIPIQVKNWIKSGLKEKYKKKGICFLYLPPSNNGPENLIFKVLNNYLKRKDEALNKRYNKTRTEIIMPCQKLSIFKRIAIWVKIFWQNWNIRAAKKVSL